MIRSSMASATRPHTRATASTDPICAPGRAFRRCLVAGALLVVLRPMPVRAAIETVTVRQAAADSALLERADGSLWRVIRGADSLSAWAYVSRRILAFSPGPFLGGGARLLIPELDQQCAVLRSDPAGRVRAARDAPDPGVESGLRAARQALELLGYDCGGAAESGWGEKCRSAFLDYRNRRGIDLSPSSLRRALLALGIDVMGRSRGSGTSVRISTLISEHRDEVADYLAHSASGSGGLNCDIASAIRTISEARDRITLVDGTVWDLPARDRARVAGWTPADSVIACDRHLISLRTGQMVRATPAR